jgi:hypothetical protein
VRQALGKIAKKLFTLLDLCVSSLRRGHANLLCIVPILTDGNPEGNPTCFIYEIYPNQGPFTPFHSLSYAHIPKGWPIRTCKEASADPPTLCLIRFGIILPTFQPLLTFPHIPPHTLVAPTSADRLSDSCYRPKHSLSAILRRKHRIPSELRS